MFDGPLHRAWHRLTVGTAEGYAWLENTVAQLVGPELAPLAPWLAGLVVLAVVAALALMLRPPPRRRTSPHHPARRSTGRPAPPPRVPDARATLVVTSAEVPNPDQRISRTAGGLAPYGGGAASPAAEAALPVDPIAAPAARASAAREDAAVDPNAEWRRPFDHLISRRGWKRLPPEFLWELVARLQDLETTVMFADFTERHRLAPKQLRKIAKKHLPEAAIAATATRLLKIGAKKKEYEETAIALALRIEAKNPEVLLGVAADHYRTRRYAAAVPLFEQGMALGQERLETLRAWPHPDPAIDRRIAALRPLLQEAAQMYMACLEEAPPAR